MASLIPALSDKAKKEIAKNINYHPILGTSSTPVWDIIEALQDLFDLKKYPITWEQLFSFIEKYLGFRKDYDLPSQIKFIYSWEDEEEGTQVEVVYFTKVIYQGNPKFCGLVSHAIVRIARLIQKRDIDIIGDIHGWWEKSQTY